ncbi:NTF2-like protein [Plenodomus tracheiphilus IPT5]|uniref:NTF2-like protein n=1 Tax=Plenodomus tracheiphilus IPT5 TaxID=1408161 RepID=A0A6A7B0B2_9PLEO|nr:NTF2-like protein [Plenodomus tracheiphilus IPT5]
MYSKLSITERMKISAALCCLAVALAECASITFKADQSACSDISFAWTISYDTKNWTKLASIVAPVLHVDLTGVLGPGFDFPAQPAAEYIATVNAPDRLGNPLVATQHLLGASTWSRPASNSITATYQFRGQHLRFSGNVEGNRTNVPLATAVMYGTVDHYFVKKYNVWKLSGLKPTTFFVEGNLTAIFA